MKRFALIGAVLAIFALAGLISADSLGINFEASQGYSPGSIQGQNGWGGQNPPGVPINPAIDQAVVTNTYGYPSFGGQSWRMSNAYTDGAFGHWPFSPSLANEAGETQALNGNGVFVFSGGVRQKHFQVQWDFASTVPTAEQPGLQVSTAPDRGDGARMSYIRMQDKPDGLSVYFIDYEDNAPYGSLANPVVGCGPEDDFVEYIVASGLSRSVPHTVKLTIDFVDGPRNDVVKVYVDGKLRHIGTTWEDYYRWCTESGGGIPNDAAADQSRTVDSMIFQARTGSGMAPSTRGYGFLIDNLSLLSSQAAPPRSVTGGGQVSVTGGRGTFGFNAKPDAGIPSGHLNYMNHFTGAHLDCTVTAISELTATTAKSSGTCSPDSAATSFKAEVEDNAEPGAGADMFKITYPSPIGTSEGGTLTSGNIQIK